MLLGCKNSATEAVIIDGSETTYIVKFYTQQHWRSLSNINTFSHLELLCFNGWIQLFFCNGTAIIFRL